MTIVFYLLDVLSVVIANWLFVYIAGVKAGIGVGSIIAAIGLVLIGILIVKQRKKTSMYHKT